MCDLTTADRFELETATRERDLGTSGEFDPKPDRWTNYGHDRLYFNALLGDDTYLDLQTGKMNFGGAAPYARVDVDGDTISIDITCKGDEYELVLTAIGGDFEADDNDDEDEQSTEEEDDSTEPEPEIATDGGTDQPTPVTDDDIRAAIERNDDPDHPDAMDVETARGHLAAMQQSFEGFWAEWMDVVEDGKLELVAETADALVFADHAGHALSEGLDAAGVDDRTDRSVLVGAIHNAANRLADWNWSTSDPVVVAKPDEFDAGQRYVEAVVNGLQQQGLSPGQAWAFYGVEIRGNSRNQWGLRKGDHDHKNVSDALEKAKAKLPR